MTGQSSEGGARAGDWLEAHNVAGGGGRRGQILEVLGREGHEHYRVRWVDEHESICYPADGVRIVRHSPHEQPSTD